MECLCPKAAAITTILRKTCDERMGQIQRVVLQRIGFKFDANAGVPNPITALASWTPLLVAADSTKISITPYVESFTIGRSEAITRGGNDNSTIDGVTKVMGSGSVPVTGLLSNVPVSIIEQIKSFICEASDPQSLGVYLINQYGKIIARELDPIANPGDVYGPIPIQSFFANFPGNDGFAADDMSDISWQFSEDWAKNRAIITPAFDVKTQLLAPAA